MRMLTAIALAYATLAAGPVAAQTYPDRPVRIIVPFAPGGPYDAIVRPVARTLEARLGQPFIIENRAGSAGNIGSAFVAKSAPADGYTLLGFSGSLVLNPTLRKDMPFDTLKDLRPVSPLALNNFVVIANPKLGVKTIADLVKLAREKPGTLNFGSSGIGSSLHLMGEWFKSLAGIDIVHVPYTGAGMMVAETVSGTVQLGFVSMPPSVPLIKSGNLTALAMLTEKRVDDMPDTPTMRESGYDMVSSSMYGLMAPTATPTEIVTLLNTEIRTALQDPKLVQLYRNSGVDPFWLSPGDLGDYLHKEIARWGEVAKKAGIKPQ